MTPPIAVVPRSLAEAAAGVRARTMFLMRIDRWDVLRDGPLSEAALAKRLQWLGYEATARGYPPGAVVVPAQTDSRERIQAVVQGLIKITIDGESAILAAGDLVFVPCGAVRRIEVVGRSAAHCLEATASGEPETDLG